MLLMFQDIVWEGEHELFHNLFIPEGNLNSNLKNISFINSNKLSLCVVNNNYLVSETYRSHANISTVEFINKVAMHERLFC